MHNNDDAVVDQTIFTISSNDGDDSVLAIVNESEFEDSSGWLYRLTRKDTMHDVLDMCIHPKCNSAMHECMKSFDLALADELIRRRLGGRQYCNFK